MILSIFQYTINKNNHLRDHYADRESYGHDLGEELCYLVGDLDEDIFDLDRSDGKDSKHAFVEGIHNLVDGDHDTDREKNEQDLNEKIFNLVFNLDGDFCDLIDER